MQIIVGLVVSMHILIISTFYYFTTKLRIGKLESQSVERIFEI